MIRIWCYLWFLAVVACIIGLTISLAFASPSCMTKAEARAAYKNDWIYWHGPDHCWDNQKPSRALREHYHRQRHHIEPTRRHVDSTLEQPKADVRDPNDYNEIDALLDAEESRKVAYPAMMSGLGVSSEMLMPQESTRWPLIIDLDAPSTFEPWDQRIK